MAAAVERALAEERILLCEAGTGTGKTLAYLVPALLSGKRVVISTATKALQEQIAYKDLPLVASTLGVHPRVVVMKGLANYVCRRRYAEFQTSVEALRPRYATALRVLEQWMPDTETGEISELAGLGEQDAIWSHVTSSSDTRIGNGCGFFEECFVTRMRREADTARIIVVNHHLFFADLSLRGPHPASVLPDYDAVIFDEAHQLEDIAGLFFGRRVSRLRTTRLVGDLTRLVATSGVNGTHVLEQLEVRLEQFWEEVLTRMADGGPRTTLEPDAWRGAPERAFFALDSALEGTLGLLGTLESARDASKSIRPEIVELLSRRTAKLRDELASIVEGSSGTVTWLEVTPAALSSTPVDLAPVFETRVFETIPSVILTSATLSTMARGTERAREVAPSGSFSYVRRRLGLVDAQRAEELIVESPFDFRANAVLYTPKDLPPARAPVFLEKAAERVVELLQLTDGGAFVLTTSLTSMKTLHRLLEGRMGQRRLLLQGSAPKQALLSAFRAAGDAVLVATQSFWEGVDVPGRALRLVVLEKLPFSVPTDPIVKARALAIESQGGNAFMELFVPGAAIALKQGFGRLIRTRQDAGIVALLDERVHTKGYARHLLRALPPVRRLDQLDDVRSFWQEVCSRS